MKTLELSLPDELHERLQRVAKETARSPKVVARHALILGLTVRDRRDRDRAILAYARRLARSPHDLDPDLESAGIECLQSSLEARQ